MTALPDVVPLAPLPPDFDVSRTRPAEFRRDWIAAQDDAELQILCNGSAFRVHALGKLDGPAICAVVPLDALFDVRMQAAKRLWLASQGRRPGPGPIPLTKTQRVRLVMALRALDGRLDGASYRDIAAILFGRKRLPARGWKTHDLRDRTIRLCNLGFYLMEGGYRQLLLHPYRQRLY